METHILKDHTGRKIGEIHDSGPVKTIHDHTGRKLGEYRSISKSTHDHTGRKIGTGNFLTSLLCIGKTIDGQHQELKNEQYSQITFEKYHLN